MRPAVSIRSFKDCRQTVLDVSIDWRTAAAQEAIRLKQIETIDDTKSCKEAADLNQPRLVRNPRIATTEITMDTPLIVIHSSSQ